jgi:formiminoglutamase
VTHRMDMSVWSGRLDAADGELGRRWHQVIQPLPTADRPGVALAGFACDVGVRRNHGRAGAAAGPRALRRFLGNLAWHGGDEARLYDAGDVECEGDALEAAQQQFAGIIAALLGAGHFPIGFGGGHEIAWGTYQGIEGALHGHPRLERLGIVNFDAHLDLRRPEDPGRGTSGTPFLQIAEQRAARGQEFRYLCVGAAEAANTEALLRRAGALGVEMILDVDAGSPQTDERILRFVEESSAIYLTFCLDVLPPAVAPGVSTPSTLGVALHRAIGLLRGLLAACGHGTPGSKLLIADIAELCPGHDVGDRTARTAARIAYEIAAFSR